MKAEEVKRAEELVRLAEVVRRVFGEPVPEHARLQFLRSGTFCPPLAGGRVVDASVDEEQVPYY